MNSSRRLFASNIPLFTSFKIPSAATSFIWLSEPTHLLCKNESCSEYTFSPSYSSSIFSTNFDINKDITVGSFESNLLFSSSIINRLEKITKIHRINLILKFVSEVTTFGNIIKFKFFAYWQKLPKSIEQIYFSRRTQFFLSISSLKFEYLYFLKMILDIKLEHFSIRLNR